MLAKKILIPIEVIPRHVHLSEKHWCEFFGENYQPQIWRNLSQRNQVVFKETLKIIGKKNTSLENFHIIGGWRKQTQVEVSEAEAKILGLKVPLRLSGRLIRSAGCQLVGPKGKIILKQGVIIPASHLHLNIKEAERLNLKQGQVVTLTLLVDKITKLENIIVRVHPSFRISLHITQETATQFWLNSGDKVFFEKEI
ncbi:MAG: PduL/EutD family phosphate acyltransferase [Candidatus Uhrbacteria bacterium]